VLRTLPATSYGLLGVGGKRKYGQHGRYDRN
jgi:hypothetical protein